MKKIVKIVLIIGGVYFISPTFVINTYELVKKEILNKLSNYNKPTTNYESVKTQLSTQSVPDDKFGNANIPSNTDISVENVINY